MTKRGRKSSASLSVISSSGIEATERPKPPIELTQEQAEEWAAIVNRLPAKWFTRETHGLLIQYCRHTIAARRVAQLVEAIETRELAPDEGFNIDAYDKLLKMQERESRTVASLATRMRMSQQARYTTQAAGTGAKNASKSKKPWDM